jgi:hypothetical protein
MLVVENATLTMKPSNKIIPRRAPLARHKKFSKHWLEAVRLSDLSVLADSGVGEGGSGSGGGEIYYQVSANGTGGGWGVGAIISPWNTTDTSSNPPLFNYSESYVVLVAGGHFGILAIENTPDGWQLMAALDGEVLISCPYDYTGSNQTYVEIGADPSGDWGFWSDFGGVGGNQGSISPYAEAYAQFGCSAGPGDYLNYNGFSNCSVSGWDGWMVPNLSSASLACTSAYQAVGVTSDSVLFEDSPPY